MNVRAVCRILGSVLRIFGATMLVPFVVALVARESDASSFAIGAAACILAGVVLRHCGKDDDIRPREAFSIVTFSWLLAGLFGGLPFWLSKSLPTYVDGVFEAISGITTAGATVFARVEGVPKATILWRSLLHWLGGMGFVVLFVAVLPRLGVGGRRLFEAEAPGPVSERLKPRIRQTAGVLWGIYVGLTAALILLLLLGKMSLFEAVVHAFSTLGTGGFSSRNLSIESFNSPYVELVLLVFMVLSGVNFAVHYRFLRTGTRRGFWCNEEFLVYLGILFVCSFLVSLDLWAELGIRPSEAMRLGSFQVVSIMTTTGYSSADFSAWPSLSKLILLLLMFVGGSGGSTAGGIKVARVIVAAKYIYRELLRLVHPRAIRHVTLDGQALDEKVVSAALGFITAYMILFMLGTLAMAGFGLEPLIAMSSVAAALGNVGPGFGPLGPHGNYATLPQAAKVLLSGLMLVGRLEIFTVLVLLLPVTWRRRSTVPR
ncbi:MAG: TrkH family potassium uptake protein [Firmicutes bacterium]|nr:TrkH family potassium uptake protein [Bacillota bacterium]